MESSQEIALSSEQEEVFSEIETLVLSAISARCAGCSTANFEPKKLAGAVANGNLSQERIVGIAARFNVCEGFIDENCHYPMPESAKPARS